MNIAPTTQLTNPKRTIKSVAVLGSGVMGSQIAMHFANAGFKVLLLDRAPDFLTPQQEAKGLTLQHPEVTNAIVEQSVQAAVKLQPNPLYHQSFIHRITRGNFTQHLPLIAQADWIIEVVIEDIAIKRGLYEQVEKFRKPGTLVTSNTSGIPIHLLAEGRSDDFKAHFSGVHFFNPPRYLKLVEIIPIAETETDVVLFLEQFIALHLGKDTVVCNDTPAFIANRIGVFSIMYTLKLMEEFGFTVEEIDYLTGPIIGRPKSATFRTADVVGIDTLAKVSTGLYQVLLQDEQREVFRIPNYVQHLVDAKSFGDKSGKGFYTKSKSANGEAEINFLDSISLEYKLKSSQLFPQLKKVSQEASVTKRIVLLLKQEGKIGQFYQKLFGGLFAYAANRMPEISNTVSKIDIAIKAGFGWEIGIFELWDAIGYNAGKVLIENQTLSAWLSDFEKAGNVEFYQAEAAQWFQNIWNQNKVATTAPISFNAKYLVSTTNEVWKNAEVSLNHIGDGILKLSFHSKMNVMGSEVMEGLAQSITIAEKHYEGIVIANGGDNFSLGANLVIPYMLACDGEWEQIDLLIQQFQQGMLRVKYASIPIVVAPHGMALGGACELMLHATAVQPISELYTGLVEFGVGLIPAGGGTKEMAKRISDRTIPGDVELNVLQQVFMNIATAKVSGSAIEAVDLHYLRKSDAITMNRSKQLFDAKITTLRLANQGFAPQQEKPIRVQGKTGLAGLLVGAQQMFEGKYISAHDKLIAEKLAFVICGGALSAPQLVSEQYLLDLEREAFLSLLGEAKTLERINGVLTGKKAVRN
jgi:3-hydroxyacyl-CoA dehydrogenase